MAPHHVVLMATIKLQQGTRRVEADIRRARSASTFSPQGVRQRKEVKSAVWQVIKQAVQCGTCQVRTPFPQNAVTVVTVWVWAHD